MADIYPHRIGNSRDSDDDFDCPECPWSGDNPPVLVGDPKEWRCPKCSALTVLEDDPLQDVAPDDSLRS